MRDRVIHLSQKSTYRRNYVPRGQSSVKVQQLTPAFPFFHTKQVNFLFSFFLNRQAFSRMVFLSFNLCWCLLYCMYIVGYHGWYWCYCGESVSGFQAGEGCSGQRWRSLLGEFWWLFLGFQSVYERLDAAFHTSGHPPGHWVCRRRGGRASTLGGRPCYQALLVPKLRRRRERVLWVSVGNIPTNVKSAKQRRKKMWN